MDRDEFIRRFTAARRRVIELDFLHLNPEQRRAVLKTEGPLLILAGAGSGKTTVLINRIANILRYGCGSDTDAVPDYADENDLAFLEKYAAAPVESERLRAVRLCAYNPAEPWQVIAITFTNKAAGELKTRLEDMLGHTARDVWAMTFHAACVRILRRDIGLLGLDSSFNIYDSSDSQSVMKRVIQDLNFSDKDFPPRSVLTVVSRAKNEGIDADEYAREAEKGSDVRKKAVARMYIEYERRNRASNALDFDDLILFAVRLLSRDETARLHYQRRFRYVLVDEYQDTNGLQYRLASLLAGGTRNICVVGDDDQSIYKFRGATIENILGFEKIYSGAEVIRLEQNYRSTSSILAAANDVITHNKSRHRKKLWTEKTGGETPRLHTAENEREEARYVADLIIDGAAEGKAFSDHAVLYRMNAQSNNFEYEFKRNNIPYKIYGGTSFYDRAEVKDVMAYLCTVFNPRDEARLLRIINTPARGIGAATVSQLTKFAQDAGQSVYDIILTCHEFTALQKSAARLSKFAELIEFLREREQAMPLDEFYDLLLESTGIIRALEVKASDENLSRIENIREVKTNIIAYLNENPDGRLVGFLEETALYSSLDSDSDSGDCVAVMTMHSAKGLEFDTVFIVGAEDGVFPGMRTIGEPTEMEEERRLCYVAMTRAKRRLFFVNARQRTLFGRTESHRTSCFVEEISSANIERPDKNAVHEDLWFNYSAEPRGTARPKVSKSKPDIKSILPPPKQKAAPPAFKKDDKVRHKAFGRGVVISVTPTGGDALLDIEFEGGVRKRLMAKSAADYMTAE